MNDTITYKCITCGINAVDVFCEVHTPRDRFLRLHGYRYGPEFSGPHEAEGALSTNRSPATLRRVVDWFVKSGFYNWPKVCLRPDTYNGLKVKVYPSDDLIAIEIAEILPTLSRSLPGNTRYEYHTDGPRLLIDWNDWPKVKSVLKETFPIRDYTRKIDRWQARIAVTSSCPKTMRIVNDDVYTSHIALNRGHMIVGEYLSTKTGIAKTKGFFKGAHQLGSSKVGSFGLRYKVPGTKENISLALALLEQPLEIMLELCVRLIILERREEAIAQTFRWRMSTERYNKDRLHKYIYNEVEDFFSFDKIKEPILEECKSLLNHMEPYSQQKIMFHASLKAKYVSWWVDMRVGKTPAAMMLMRHLIETKQVDHFVVVAPAINVYEPWYTELEKQGTFSVCVLDEGMAKDEEAIWSEGYDIYVISYTSLGRRLPIMQWYWSMESVGWVFDETSLIKNPTSKRAKAARQATEHAPYVFALNGTPLAQGPQDIWAQQMVVDQGVTFGTSFNRFVDFWLDRPAPGKFSINKRVAMLFELRLAASSIRFIRSEADQFSGKDKNFRYIGMPATQEIRTGTEEILRGFTRDEENFVRDIKSCILTIYGHLRECCGGYNKYEVVPDSGDYKRVRHEVNSKVIWLKTFIKGNPGQPVVIYSENNELEDMIMEMMKAEGIVYSYVRPKGSTSPLTGMKRLEQIQKFQRGDTSVILMKSSQAKGITLNRKEAVNAGLGSYPAIVYTQPTWSLIDWEQSQDRCCGTDDKTQKSISTMVYVLVVKGSIEEQIVGALRRKKKVAETLLADAERNGYNNPFEDMDFSGESELEEDELFDAVEMDARYKLRIAPYKKLSERMIRKADVKYRADKFRTTQKAQEAMPLSEAAVYLMAKYVNVLPTARIGEDE